MQVHILERRADLQQTVREHVEGLRTEETPGCMSTAVGNFVHAEDAMSLAVITVNMSARRTPHKGGNSAITGRIRHC